MNAPANERGVYLDAYLRPLAVWLESPDVTDILINAPGEVWVETIGGETVRHLAPELTDTTLWRLATQIAAAGHQGVNREHPLLAATLPDGARVQIIAPPATRGPMAIAIRKHVVADLGLDDYAEAGAFDNVRSVGLEDRSAEDGELEALLNGGDISGFLRNAVLARKNIIVSGGTSTGKTTFLNALVKEVPITERLITIEDTPEIQLNHPNAVGLIAARGSLGEARITVEDLLQASLRMRPDRIILGEASRSRGLQFPARGELRPSRLDHDGARRQSARRRGSDRAHGDAGWCKFRPWRDCGVCRRRRGRSHPTLTAER